MKCQIKGWNAVFGAGPGDYGGYNGNQKPVIHKNVPIIQTRSETVFCSLSWPCQKIRIDKKATCDEKMCTSFCDFDCCFDRCRGIWTKNGKDTDRMGQGHCQKMTGPGQNVLEQYCITKHMYGRSNQTLDYRNRLQEKISGLATI